MKQSKYPLWSGRDLMPELSIFQKILFCAVIVVVSAMTVSGLGAMICVVLAGAAFALFLCTDRSPLPWITIPLSFGAAYFLCNDLAASACVLLFVPVGVALAYCVFTGRSLSVTLAVVCVFVAIAAGANLAVSVLKLYEGGIYESFRAFGSDVKLLMKDYLAQTFEQYLALASRYGAESGEAYALPEEALDLFVENAILIMPAVAVMACELFSYIAIRIMRFASRLAGRERLLFPGRYIITISVPTAVLYLAATAVGTLSTEASVIAYSAINITYMLMPVACAAGFNLLLGRDGLIRRRFAGRNKTVFIVICVVFAITSFLAFVQMLAMFASAFAIVRAFIMAKRAKTDGDNNDR